MNGKIDAETDVLPRRMPLVGASSRDQRDHTRINFRTELISGGVARVCV